MSSMMIWEKITTGEKLYDITSEIQAFLQTKKNFNLDAVNEAKALLLFCPHTSCALTTMEAHEENARGDVEHFLQQLAPRHLPFIKHKTEGPDDSPSHMKSLLLQSSITFILDKGQICLGQWQGIFLAEFRDGPKARQLYLQLL